MRFRTAYAIAWAVFVCGNAGAAEVRWTVSATDTANGILRVSLRIPIDRVGERDYATFTFPDAHGYSGTVSHFRAKAGGQSVRIDAEPTERGARFRVQKPSIEHDLLVQYDVDSRFYPPGSDDGSRRDARAILEPELGILRTRTVFAAGSHLGMEGRVTIKLPPGWLAVTPWEIDGDSFVLAPNALRDTEYLAVGPFDLTDRHISGTDYRIATMGAGEDLVERLPALIETAQRFAGVPPRDADAIHTVILTPRGFLQGGSAGRRTVVQAANPVTLAHEVFHWWNHSAIAEPDARWFTEGFTEYFAIRIAEDSGLIDSAYAEACIADLNGEVRFLERDNALSLVEASSRYGEREAQRIVYGKGALLAYWMNRELEKTGRELNALLPVVFHDAKKRHTNADLFHAFDVVFDGALNDAFTTYVESAEPLPDLGLPEATGESGRTRFLPK